MVTSLPYGSGHCMAAEAPAAMAQNRIGHNEGEKAQSGWPLERKL